MKPVKYSKARSVVYLVIASAMLFYALPRLELDSPWSLMSVFGLVWIGFALLFIAANVNALLFTSEEQRKELARIKRAKAMLWEQKLQQHTRARSRH